MTGELKFFDARKRFGIIIPDGISARDKENQVFFYEDVLQSSADNLQAGQQMEYSLNPNTQTPRALWVKPLGKVAYVPINSQRKAAAYGSD